MQFSFILFYLCLPRKQKRLLKYLRDRSDKRSYSKVALMYKGAFYKVIGVVLLELLIGVGVFILYYSLPMIGNKYVSVDYLGYSWDDGAISIPVTIATGIDYDSIHVYTRADYDLFGLIATVVIAIFESLSLIFTVYKIHSLIDPVKQYLKQFRKWSKDERNWSKIWIIH